MKLDKPFVFAVIGMILGLVVLQYSLIALAQELGLLK